MPSALGFDFCGISRAEVLDSDRKRLETWLNQGRHGRMAYMENHFEKRTDPTLLVDGAKSVISLLYNYFPEKEIPKNNNYKIARYAYGEDYHHVVRNKLKEFLEQINLKIGHVTGRVFVDSAPVMERQWAARSGLGWIGKNTMLINKRQGSYFFIAELIVDLELEYDQPVSDYCGTCTRCMDACPTNALSSYQMDASKCISYLTIELKDGSHTVWSRAEAVHIASETTTKKKYVLTIADINGELITNDLHVDIWPFAQQIKTLLVHIAHN